MAQYRVIEPSLEKLDELARLSFNIIFYREEFKRTLGEEAKRKEDDSEFELKKWLKNNTEKVNTLNEG